MHAPTHQRTNAPTHQRTNAPTHQRTNAPTHQRTNAPTHQRTNAPTHQRTTNKYRSPKGILRLLINNSSKPILKRSLFTLIFPPFLISSPAYSALTTIETQNIIHGIAPYLTFDNGKTKATDASSLLSIKLSDGRIFTPENNPSTPENPIELPDGNKSLADIQMFMPVGKTSISLNELVNAPYNYGVDENGDVITATGNLTLDLRDSQYIEVNLSDKLIPCSPSDYPIDYYSINLSNNEGKLTTKYGYPNTTSFNAANVIYYVIPKAPTHPIACYAAKPHGIYGDWNYSQVEGPASQWDKQRGYLLQDIDNPASNFPTTGTHGLNFNLVVSNGVNWQDMSYDKSPNSSGLDIVLKDPSIGGYPYNNVNIFLTGPNKGVVWEYPDTVNNNPPDSAVPTTFNIYSDKAKTNKIYSFTISKWFIADYNNLYLPYDPNYCNNYFGSRYRTPIVSDLTNANGESWSGGLAGQPNNYQHRIGGGLYAEWGIVDNEFYPNITFNSWVWATDPQESKLYFIAPSAGEIMFYNKEYEMNASFTCVTP